MQIDEHAEKLQERAAHDDFHNTEAFDQVSPKPGIDATPAATDFEAPGPGPSGLLAWTASPAALDVTTRALTEYVGWLVYRNRGWIGGDHGS